VLKEREVLLLIVLPLYLQSAVCHKLSVSWNSATAGLLLMKPCEYIPFPAVSCELLTVLV